VIDTHAHLESLTGGADEAVAEAGAAGVERILTIGREQFYAGKTVAREEWLVSAGHYFDNRWGEGCWGRLRVFSDGTADAWISGIGSLGYDDEESARRELSQAKFFPWEDVRERPYSGRLPEPPPPPVGEADDPSQPFLYEGGS